MNLFSKIKAAVVGQSKLSAQFNQTLSVKIAVEDRVRRRADGQLGTCIQTGTVDGTVKVPAISVKHDDGTEAWLVPAEEYTKIERRKF